jgi:hypothetical protein
MKCLFIYDYINQTKLLVINTEQLISDDAVDKMLQPHTLWFRNRKHHMSLVNYSTFSLLFLFWHPPAFKRHCLENILYSLGQVTSDLVPASTSQTNVEGAFDVCGVTTTGKVTE